MQTKSAVTLSELCPYLIEIPSALQHLADVPYLAGKDPLLLELSSVIKLYTGYDLTFSISLSFPPSITSNDEYKSLSPPMFTCNKSSGKWFFLCSYDSDTDDNKDNNEYLKQTSKYYLFEFDPSQKDTTKTLKSYPLDWKRLTDAEYAQYLELCQYKKRIEAPKPKKEPEKSPQNNPSQPTQSANEGSMFGNIFQKVMQIADAPRKVQCVGGCGFMGSTDTKSCCSQCFQKLHPQDYANHPSFQRNAQLADQHAEARQARIDDRHKQAQLDALKKYQQKHKRNLPLKMCCNDDDVLFITNGEEVMYLKEPYTKVNGYLTVFNEIHQHKAANMVIRVGTKLLVYGIRNMGNGLWYMLCKAFLGCSIRIHMTVTSMKP
eukprot:316280_1